MPSPLNGVVGPFFQGVGPVDGGVAEGFFGVEDTFGFAVAVEVGELGGFVVDLVVDFGHGPVLVDTVGAGVYINAGVGAGEAVDEVVGEFVVVEVVDEGEEVVGVFVVGEVGAFDLLAGGFVDFVAFGEVGAFVPEWAGDDVDFAVGVEVGEVGAFAVELVGEG